MRNIKSKVSIAFRVLDAVTGKPVNKNLIRLNINGIKADTVFKDDGYAIVLNLPDNLYVFDILSDMYLSERIIINLADIDPLNPVIPVILNPGPIYPGAADMTCIHGKIQYSKGSQEQIDVFTVYSRSLEKIKIAQETVKKGSTRVKLYSSGKKELAGRTFLISNKNEANGELCRIISGPDDKDNYIFDHELMHTHNRGEILRSAVKMQIDSTGSFYAKIYNIDTDNQDVLIVVRESSKILFSKLIMLEHDTENDAGIIEI